MSAPMITAIDAREVLECRGLPTVQVDITLDDGTADVPSGRSTGAYEVAELRDGGERFGAFGVRGAANSLLWKVNQIGTLWEAGAPVRGERTAKYNRLTRISEEIGETAVYPGDVFGQVAVSVGP